MLPIQMARMRNEGWVSEQSPGVVLAGCQQAREAPPSGRSVCVKRGAGRNE
jgi:hypothetical protein